MCCYLISPLLLLMFSAVACDSEDSKSPPGKPALLDCRSPDKETFTCRWEAGSDGGLPTSLRLFYTREQMDGIHECPDYGSTGSNTCFFDRSHTSIWVDYFLTVVASNQLGNTTSDVFKVDVMEIVKPDAPENISVQVMRWDDHAHLSVTWQPPGKIDSRSGWVTIKYQVRFKEETSDQWKVYTSGTEKHFDLYSISAGLTYHVQVRCRLDHGEWSEWSEASSVETPGYPQTKTFWIVVSALSTLSALTAACVLLTKRRNVKQWLLPPVPGPKIKGIDVHLLKKGRTDVTNVLIVNQSFPSFVALKDENFDFLVVSDDITLPDPSTSQKSKKSFNVLSREISEMKSLSDDKQLQAEVTGQRSVCDVTVDQLFLHRSYMYVQRRVNDIQEQDDMLPEDYSRVKEMGRDNTILLQEQSADSSHHTDCTNKKPQSPDHVTSKVGMCTELMDSGYIETIPALPLM